MGSEPSYFIWGFKKEEAQKVERTYSFDVKVKKRGRGKERRGRRREEEKIPELGTLL